MYEGRNNERGSEAAGGRGIEYGKQPRKFRGHSLAANPGRLDSRKARRAEAAAAKAGQTSQTNAQDVKCS